MKLHIHDPLRKSENDHQNISCLPSLTLNQRIGAVCCLGEAKQVYLNHAISHWDKENFIKNMSNIAPLLSVGGILTIKDSDLLLLCNSIMREPTNRDACLSVITKAKWVYEMAFIKDVMLMHGFSITNSYYVLDDFSFTIIGVKN